jgi:hypothetical protein
MGKYDYFVKLMNDFDKEEKQELTFEEENGEQKQTNTQQER